MTVVIIQRTVPHYRMPFFEKLYQRTGWKVACSRKPPPNTFLNTPLPTTKPPPFLQRFDFRFWQINKKTYTYVPLKDILDELNPEAIICEWSLNMSSSYELVLRRKLNLAPPFAFHTHGLKHTRDGFFYGIPFSLKSRLTTAADAVVSYSMRGKQSLSGKISEDRLFVAPNTIDIEQIEEARKRCVEVPYRGKPRLLAVGRMTKDKEFVKLVRIVRSLETDLPGIKLVIIGDGPEMAKVKEEAGDALGRCIDLPGAVHGENRLAPYFSNADLFVLLGAAGLSVNHAIAYGLPVLAISEFAEQAPFHHPEIEYVVPGKTGWLLDEVNEMEIRCKIRELFQSSVSPRDRLKDSLEGYSKELLNIDRMITGFEDVGQFLLTRENR